MRGLLCILVSLTLLSFALPGTTAFSHSEPSDYPEYDGWAAPLDFSGDITIAFTVDFGANNHCTFHVAMASVDPDGDVYLHATGPMGATAWGGRVVQAHAGDLDTREITTSAGGGFGMRMWATGTFSGSQEVRITVFSATALTFDPSDPWSPIAYEIGCEDPFTVADKAGGREALGFTHQSLDGTGASANGLLVGASANVGGTTGTTITRPDARLDWFHWGDGLGSLEVAVDDGEQQTAHRSDFTGATIGAYEGGPGAYTLTLDRVAGGSFEVFLGVLTGTGPVDGFDELV